MSPRSHGLSPRVPFVPEPLSRSFDRRVLRIAPLVPPAYDPLDGQGANDDGLPLGPASAVELLALAYGRRVDRSACLICIILQSVSSFATTYAGALWGACLDAALRRSPGSRLARQLSRRRRHLKAAHAKARPSSCQRLRALPTHTHLHATHTDTHPCGSEHTLRTHT